MPNQHKLPLVPECIPNEDDGFPEFTGNLILTSQIEHTWAGSPCPICFAMAATIAPTSGACYHLFCEACRASLTLATPGAILAYWKLWRLRQQQPEVAQVWYAALRQWTPESTTIEQLLQRRALAKTKLKAAKTKWAANITDGSEYDKRVLSLVGKQDKLASPARPTKRKRLR